jgi:PAS domain S-box-containing protein
MDFLLGLNFASSALLFVEFDKDFHTKCASSGWNKFCEGLSSIDVWQLLDAVEAKSFREWLRTDHVDSYDLWVNHPTQGRSCLRCQKINKGAADLVLQLVMINDIALEKKLFKLLSGLTEVSETFHDSPALLHEKSLQYLVTFLRAQSGAFGHFETETTTCWLAHVGAPPLSPAADHLNHKQWISDNGTTYIPLRHENKTIGLIGLEGMGPVLMSDAGWKLIGQFFTALCLQAISRNKSQLLRNKLTLTQSFLEQTNSVGMIGGWEVRVDRLQVYWTEETHRIHGTDPRSYTPNVNDGLQFYVPEHREDITAVFTRLLQTGAGFDRIFQIQQASGNLVWVRVVGKAEMVHGQTIRVFGIFQNIDELHRSNLLISEANKKLELVQSASSDGFWDWDLKSNIVTYSPRWKTMLGYEVDELPDGYDTWKNLIHPDDLLLIPKIVEAHWTNRLPYSHTSRFKHKDGSWRTILVRGQSVRDANDKPIRMLGVHTDITDLTELRKEAKDQAFKTSFVMNALGIGIWDWDVEKNRLTWDDQLFELFGVSKNDFSHSFEDWRKTVDPAYLAEAEQRVAATLESGLIFDHVFKLKREYGAKMVKGHGVILRDNQGKPRRLIGINYDVSREKALEQELEVFKQLAELSPDIVGLMNPRGAVIFLNQSAMAIGWKRGDQSQKYFPPASVELFQKTILPILERTGKWEGEVLFRDNITGEEFPVMQRAFMMKDKHGKVQAIATVAMDLREKRRLENEIERQRLQFINNSKMSALGEMASGMAHEINNPLAILKGNITILRLKAEAAELAKDSIIHFLDKQDRTVDRIAEIISGLRSFARDHSQTEFSSFKIQDMILHTLPFCEARFQNNGVAFTHQMPELGLPVRGRETQLSQAVLNLLNNAFDAVAETPGAWIRLAVSVEGARIKISLKNSGPLIAKELRDRIMEPFFTTKDVGKGTGLGLSISKGIVETHGGRLYLDGEAPETTFVIELPLGS